MSHQTAAPGDHSPDRKTCFGIDLQSRIAHFLLHLKALRSLPFFGWDRFVNVGRHRSVSADHKADA